MVLELLKWFKLKVFLRICNKFLCKSQLCVISDNCCSHLALHCGKNSQDFQDYSPKAASHTA